MEIQIVKAGWLYRKSSVLGRWKKNWFVLNRDGELLYFENQDKHEPEGRLLLRAVCLGILSTGQCDFTPPENGSKMCLLQIKLRNDDDLKLCAESPDDMKAWQMALEEARAMNPAGPTGVPPGVVVPPGAQVVYPQAVRGAGGYGYGYGPTYYTAPGQYAVRDASGNRTVFMGNQPGQVVCVQDPYYYRSYPYMWGPVLWW